MKRPLVSIALPVRNAGTTFEAALGSLQKQSIDDLEIIIVDHGSSDDTASLIRKAAAEDSRIRHFEGKGTFVEAANLAWEMGTGDFVARMDGDDVAYPDRIEKQLAFLEHNHAIAACGSLVRIVKQAPDGSPAPPDDGYRRYNEWINSVKTPEAILRERFVDSPIPNPTAMIRREVLVETGGYRDPAWAEDYDFWLRLLQKGYSIGKIDEVLLDWYDFEQRSTRTLARYELSQFQSAKAHYLSQIEKVRDLGVFICGAGPVGKEFARFDRGEKGKDPCLHRSQQTADRELHSRDPRAGHGDLPRLQKQSSRAQCHRAARSERKGPGRPPPRRIPGRPRLFLRRLRRR